MSRIRTPASLLACALALAPLAARADLLVTRDGAVVETRGAWRVEGRRVVFTLPNGQLSSLRTDDLDLDRSALATARAAEEAAAQQAAPAAPAPGAEPVLRLTEKDIPPMTEGDEGEGAPAEGEAKADEAAGGVPLEVVSWDKVELDSGEGVQVFGTLRNTGTGTLISPALTVSVYGDEGGLLAMSEATVNLTAIPAGRTANFRAEFPGLPDFAAARFVTSGRGYEGSAPPAGEDEGLLPEAEEGSAPEELEPEPEPTAEDEPPPAV